MFNNINIKSTPKTNFGEKITFFFPFSSAQAFDSDVYYTFNLHRAQKKNPARMFVAFSCPQGFAVPLRIFYPRRGEEEKVRGQI
jgi:hypothetical protein